MGICCLGRLAQTLRISIRWRWHGRVHFSSKFRFSPLCLGIRAGSGGTREGDSQYFHLIYSFNSIY